jgi:hypothetical protein
MTHPKDASRRLAERVAKLPNTQVFTVNDLRELTELVAELAARVESLETRLGASRA